MTADTDRAATGVRATGLVVVCHNNLSYTRLCFDALRRFTAGPLDVALVDNGSTDGTAEWAGSLSGPDLRVRVVRNRENRGFAPAVNQGLAALRGTDVVLLNNDVVVTRGWLARMREELHADPKRGIVGPLSGNTSFHQRIQTPDYGDDLEKMHALAADLAVRRRGLGKDVPGLSGFCMLIRREVIEAIGGFDERFVPGFFEDDDYSLRARRAGFTLRVVRDVYLHHFESRTFRLVVPDMAAALLANWARFKAKWGLPEDLAFRQGHACDEIPPGPFDPARDVVPLPAGDAPK